MSYLVLARKWRPKTFDDIIGQEYITRSLKNAVSTGKTAHAILLSGPRGVGKTSSARILAKALNCKDGPTQTPCSECAFCIEISEGKSLDVMEIDAASHTGVNDVREIIENIKYLPASGKYKIYIIDEAHMLSQSAFNALLKTLEEPPPHVLFILATTEVHKVPVTILSRCQRYDFTKVTIDKIRERLSFITSAENVEIPGETLYTVAREADGSMRDALSLMDQLLATFGSKITHEDALRILGVLDRTILKSALMAVIGKDPKSSIDALNLAMEKGINPKRFAEDLLWALRHALLLKTCGSETVTELPDEEKKELAGIIADESVETLELLFGLTLEGAEGVQRSFYPRTALEFTLIKLATLERTVPIESIISRIERLTGGTRGSEPRPGLEEPRGGYGKAPEKTAGPAPQASETGAKQAPAHVDKSEPGPGKLPDFIKYVKSKNGIMGMRLEQAKDIHVGAGIFRIVFESSMHTGYFKKAQDTLREYMKEFFTGEQSLEIAESGAAPADEAGNTKTYREENKKKIHDDPALKDTLEIFGGRVINVKPKDKE